MACGTLACTISSSLILGGKVAGRYHEMAGDASLIEEVRHDAASDAAASGNVIARKVLEQVSEPVRLCKRKEIDELEYYSVVVRRT